MSDPLTRALLERVAGASRATGVRVGTVLAVDATNLALTVDVGGPVTGVRWISSYAPTVGDVVVVVSSPIGWVVLGKLSKQLGAGTVVFGTATFAPGGRWAGAQLVGSPTWAWTTLGIAGYQGRDYDNFLHATVWSFDRLTDMLPAGATVTAAKLRLTRWADDNIPDLKRPRVYLHGYSSAPSGSPTWSAGPWSPGALQQGEVGTWDLPSAWLTALLAGTARGVGLYSSAVADYSLWDVASAALVVSYSAPA